MAHKGVCEVCGFADDSYRIEEGDSVLKVCKLCYDGYMERTDAKSNAASSSAVDSQSGIEFADIPPDDLEEIQRELAEQKKGRKVAALDSSQLGMVLAPTEDDKKVLGNVRRRQLRMERKAAAKGIQVAWEDDGSDEEDGEEVEQIAKISHIEPEPSKKKKKPSRSEKNIAKIREEAEQQNAILRTRIQGILTTLEEVISDDEMEEQASAFVRSESVEGETAATDTDETVKEPEDSAETEVAQTEVTQAEEPSPEQESEREEEPPAEQESEQEEEPPAEVTEPEEQKSEEEQKEPEPESVQEQENTETETETDMANKEKEVKPDAETKESIAREKIIAAANQTIDDDRIKITSPEIALSKDKRLKTNLDVAMSEYAGGVRFLNSFKYVMHRVSYTVFLALIVLAVATVTFVLDGWQKALVQFGGGVGAVGIGFLLMWYLSHCYELDRRAMLLRIRQQEILFASMDTDCYRELRTKFTMIKALGWLLSKLSVLLPLAVVVGGNVAAVIVGFRTVYYWLFPVISAAASLAAVIVYYFVKFAADCVSYALDRERNQQIEQQTLLDILSELRKKK